ncbi:type 1 glutamine amidotransferase domain-containing protein [Pseudomonas cremoricolorata]|uniref:Glutamine amidotransferase n=1 Tax=Pseudomonas cremoricolorata TaxID=157783 RepID=A0A089WNL8_9PSED|nr:type 1 glutamine amidotransferase domain-containing protein [Pseudomonas cremoricolorata]AIR90910.1 glutamine amidotransferase [Pseudomonas cremoricolorata]
MSSTLTGKRVLIITSDTGIERDELLSPLKALADHGASVTHASIKGAEVQTFLQDTEKDRIVTANAKLSEVKADDYQALVIPGGTVNADNLRQDADALRLIKAFADAGKVVAAICHGPWALIDAGVIEGKTLTSYPSVKTDLVNGKGQWVDAEVKQCNANGWHLITSRTPDDLPAFNQAIAQALA